MIGDKWPLLEVLESDHFPLIFFFQLSIQVSQYLIIERISFVFIYFIFALFFLFFLCTLFFCLSNRFRHSFNNFFLYMRRSRLSYASKYLYFNNCLDNEYLYDLQLLITCCLCQRESDSGFYMMSTSMSGRSLKIFILFMTLYGGVSYHFDIRLVKNL